MGLPFLLVSCSDGQKRCGVVLLGWWRVGIAVEPWAAGVRVPQVRDGAVGDGLRAGQGQALGEVGSPSAPPGTPVLVEYLGWIFVSGRM